MRVRQILKKKDSEKKQKINTKKIINSHSKLNTSHKKKLSAARNHKLNLVSHKKKMKGEKENEKDKDNSDTPEPGLNKMFPDKPTVKWTDNCAVKCDLCKGLICGDICCSVGKCKEDKTCEYDFTIVVEGCNEHKNGRLSCKIADADDKERHAKVQMGEDDESKKENEKDNDENSKFKRKC